MRTEKSYVHWVRYYIRFHRLGDPQEMGASGVTAFRKHLAAERRVSASIQNQALAAILFMWHNLAEVRSPVDLIPVE